MTVAARGVFAPLAGGEPVVVSRRIRILGSPMAPLCGRATEPAARAGAGDAPLAQNHANFSVVRWPLEAA
jgi:hypothetical protein